MHDKQKLHKSQEYCLQTIPTGLHIAVNTPELQ